MIPKCKHSESAFVEVKISELSKLQELEEVEDTGLLGRWRIQDFWGGGGYWTAQDYHNMGLMVER